MSNKPTYEQQGVAMTCRSYEEYLKMFALSSEGLLKGSILDVAAGASSFVAEANMKGLKATAVDPMYELHPDAILHKGLQEIEISTAKLANLQEHFDWTYYGNIENHRNIREASLQTFVKDYRSNGDSRYISAMLPELPFSNESFELVLCSHFLFLYGEQFDGTFHRQAINELLRVCRKGGQVLIYPLKTLGFELYSELAGIVKELGSNGVEARYGSSELPFIPGSSELLSLVKHK
ncbi:Methyltransferase domain protein [compost metagenome]